jgi:uncharacterized membrane protein YqjE
MESSQRSVGDLTRDLSEQTSVLVRKELALASAEMKEKATHAGTGAGLFGGAALFALFAFGTLIATAILALSEVVDAWLAALIVTVVLLAIAGIAALLGRREVDEGTPLKPEKATHEVAVDTETVKEAARRGFDRTEAHDGR